LRLFVLMALGCVSACSWFGSKRALLPDPTQIIVAGAPMGSVIFIDGVQTGQATGNAHPQVLKVAAGAHLVEIHSGDPVVYREDTYVGPGERRVVTVLSGSTR
jgi:hypothetical protein